MQAKLLIVYLLIIGFISIKTIEVSTVEELVKALGKARAGQVIAIAPGVYDYSTYERMIRFELYADGTKTSPIILTVQDPDNPPLLKGTGNTVLYVTGNYWVIDNIKLSSTTRGLEINNASYNTRRKLLYLFIKSPGIRAAGQGNSLKISRCFTADFQCLLSYGTCGTKNGQTPHL